MKMIREGNGFKGKGRQFKRKDREGRKGVKRGGKVEKEKRL